MNSLNLDDAAARFATSLQDTFRGVLPAATEIVSVKLGDRYVVRPAGDEPAHQRIPLTVDGEALATLGVQIYLGPDSSGRHLKAWKSSVAIHSMLDRAALFRQEFDALISESAPLAHWHVHAERGALSHLLARAHAVRPRQVPRPHDMSALHLPVGGERFRPCVEDVLEFAARELGIDVTTGWKSSIAEGRERWRRMQFRSTVRDLQDEAAEVLRDYGWNVSPPETRSDEGEGVLRRW